MQDEWLIGQWDDIEREWLDLKHVEASSPRRRRFSARFAHLGRQNR